MLKKLHILEFNKYKIKKYHLDIPENIENVRNLHEYYREKTKQLCEYLIFYINNGNILKESEQLKGLNTDIILINVIQSIRFSNYTELINNATSDIRTFLNTVFANSRTGTSNHSVINSTPESISSNTFSVIEEDLSQNNSQLSNTTIQSSSTIIVNECNETTTQSEANENDNNENQDNDSINNDNENQSNNINYNNDNENQSNMSSSSEDENDSDDETESNNDNQEERTLENNNDITQTTMNITNVTPDVPVVDNNLTDVVNIINNLSNNSVSNIFNLSNSVNSFEEIQGGNNQTTSETNNISEKYKEEYEKMISMGFTDERLVSMSLNLAQGNLENAINLYLADYQF